MKNNTASDCDKKKELQAEVKDAFVKAYNELVSEKSEVIRTKELKFMFRGGIEITVQG